MLEPLTYYPIAPSSPSIPFPTKSSFPSSSPFSFSTTSTFLPSPSISSKDFITNLHSTTSTKPTFVFLPDNQMIHPRCSAFLSLPFNQNIIDSFVSSFKSWDCQQQMFTLLNLVLSITPEQMTTLKTILNEVSQKEKTAKIKESERHSNSEQIPNCLESKKHGGHKKLIRTLSLLPECRNKRNLSSQEKGKLTEKLITHTAEHLNTEMKSASQCGEINDGNRNEMKTISNRLTFSNTAQNVQKNDQIYKNISKNNSLDCDHKLVEKQSSFSSFDSNHSKEDSSDELWTSSLSFWLKHLRLHKYYTSLQHLSFHQLFSLSQQYLVDLSLTVGATDRLLLNIKMLDNRNQKVDFIAKGLENSSLSISRLISELSSILKSPFFKISPENEDVKEVCDFGLIQKVLEASMKISDVLAGTKDEEMIDLFNALVTIAIKNPSIPPSYTDSFRSLRQKSKDNMYFNQKMQLRKSFSYNYSRNNKQPTCNSQFLAHQQLARRKTTTSSKATLSDYFQERFQPQQENKKNLQKHPQLLSIKPLREGEYDDIIQRGLHETSAYQTFMHGDFKCNSNIQTVKKNTLKNNQLNKRSTSEIIWQDSLKNYDSLNKTVDECTEYVNSNGDWKGNIDEKHYGKNNQNDTEISNHKYNKTHHKNNNTNNANNNKSNDEAYRHISKEKYQHTRVDKMLSVPERLSLIQH